MTEIIHGHLYDYPKYYDLVYGSDWKAEFGFLKKCFAQHTDREVKRLFEPACGTGRLMIKLARAGYEVAGNDLNPHAVEFCNKRLQKAGFPASATVGDMSDFRVKRKVDAAYNMINSFRHLPTEKAARGHIRCVADALAVGGLFILGLHLTPTVGDRVETEEWSARRGNLCVVSSMWSEELDLKKRNERVGISFDIYTLTGHQRIIEEMDYRTWTAPQMKRLLASVPELEVVATYDFRYDWKSPITVDEETEDVVYILKKRRRLAKA